MLANDGSPCALDGDEGDAGRRLVEQQRQALALRALHDAGQPRRAVGLQHDALADRRAGRAQLRGHARPRRPRGGRRRAP